MTSLDRFRWWPALQGLTLGVVLGSAPVYAQLTVEPEALSVTVTQHETATQTVTLTNEGDEPLSFCLSFDRPLQQTLRGIKLHAEALESACGAYGEVLALVDENAVPDAGSWDPYGLTMAPDGHLFVADYFRIPLRTHELTSNLTFIRSFEHPFEPEFNNSPVTTGVTYRADTGTLWWLNIESAGFAVYRALLLEGDLDGGPTGRRIELPIGGPDVPPNERSLPVGVAYDPARQHFYYTDIRSDTIWAVDTLGYVVDGYPVTPKAYPGGALGFGLDAHPSDVGGATDSVRLELIVSPPGPPPPRIGVIGPLGGDLGAGTTLETPIPDLTGGTGGGGASGEPVRSRLDPNGVLYVPFGNFDTEGVAAIRPHPLPPSWLVVEAWDGTLASGESMEIELTFRPGTRPLGEYTAMLQAFEAESGAAVEVPLAMMVTQGTDAEDEAAAPEASSLTVHPNPTAGRATVTLALSAAAEVRAAVYDVLGREVAMLHEGPLASGSHRLAFDTDLPLGVYLVRATGDGVRTVQRVTVVR